MNVKDVERIQGIISEAEIKSAKAQGSLDSVKKQWKELFGKDDIASAKAYLESLKADIEKTQKECEELYNELMQCADWDALEEELL